MSGPGRNEPCPCGSGRKYKACCLAVERPRLALQHPFHRLDDRATSDILAFARQSLGEVRLMRLLQSWGLDLGVRDAPLALQLSFHVRRSAGRTLAERYAEEAPQAWRHGAVLQAHRGAWLSVWEILEVRQGEGLELHDLVTGERRSVHESSASRLLIATDTLLTRVVAYEGAHLLAGTHSAALPPQAAADVLVKAGIQPGATPDELRDDGKASALVGAWIATVDALERRPRPQAANTDGDPILLTTDTFVFERGRIADIRAGLSRVEGMEIDGDAGNILRSASVGRTVLANVEILEDRVTISTNSIRRADSVRGSVEVACEGLLRHRSREHSDPLSEAFRASVRERGARGNEIGPEEASAVILQIKSKHYATWCDEPLPILGGKTPRQAAGDAGGRAQVALLLKEMENGEARQPEGSRYDFSILRDELGLPR